MFGQLKFMVIIVKFMGCVHIKDVRNYKNSESCGGWFLTVFFIVFMYSEMILNLVG